MHEYFLREGRGWKPVSEEEFASATSEEVVKELHEQLTQKLRERVEKLMSKQAKLLTLFLEVEMMEYFVWTSYSVEAEDEEGAKKAFKEAVAEDMVDLVIEDA